MLEHPGVEASDLADLPAREGNHEQAWWRGTRSRWVGAVGGQRRLPVRPRLHDAQARPCAHDDRVEVCGGLPTDLLERERRHAQAHVIGEQGHEPVHVARLEGGGEPPDEWPSGPSAVKRRIHL
jgi:hypothetical protein